MLKNQKVLFLGILLLGLILRLFSLETNGLWLDEIWSMLASSPDKSMGDVIQTALKDTHPPLFDLLLFWSLKLSGNAEFTGRYLALLFGMLGVIGCFSYGKKIANENRIGLLLMAICSFNFFHIYYSFEGRFYSLIFLLSLICIGEFYLYFKDKKARHAVAYTISAILLCYTHYYGGVLLAALSVVALTYWISKEIEAKKFWQFIGIQAIVLLAFAPCLPYLFGKSGLPSWMSDPSIGDFFNYFYLYSGKNPLEFAWLFLPLLFFFKIERNKKLTFLLYGTILLGFLIPFLVSKLNEPMLHKRYTVIYLPAIFIMSALAWTQIQKLQLKRSFQMYAGIALTCILNMVFLRVEFKADSKDQWKEAAAYLEMKDAKSIVANQTMYLNFYLDRMDLPAATEGNSIENLPNEFWLLKSNFDERDLLAEYQLQIMESKELPKKFTIYKVSKP